MTSFLSPHSSALLRREGLWLGHLAATVGLLAAAGVAIAATPRPGLVLVLAALFTGMLLLGTALRVEQFLTVALVGGAVVLGYGFANLGIRSGLAPVPLAEMLLLPLVAAAALGRTEWRLPKRFAWPVLLYATIVGARFVFDYPVWHSLAIRDATIGVEVLTVFVGYRAVARDGLVPWVRRIRLMFVALLVLGSFVQFNWVEAHSPIVGLQQSVPLLSGASVNGAALVAAFAYFALYSTGLRRTLLMAWSLALIAVEQERGLYIALVLVPIVLGWSLRRPTAIWMRALAALGVAAVLLVLATGIGISGRLGKITPDFYIKHVATLAGDQGPGAGSFKDRVNWAHKTLALMSKSTKTEIVGVGLGPDLAFGFKSPQGTDVRKPHDDYLEVLARTGLLGLTLFIVMICSLLAPIARARPFVDAETRRFRAFVLAALAAYLAVAGTQPLLAYAYGTVPVFLLLGMGLAAVSRSPGLTRQRPDDAV